MNNRLVMGGALLALACLGHGCRPKQSGGSPSAMMVQVVAQAVQEQPIRETLSLVGDIVANEAVEIKAETEGIVQEIFFKEGQEATNSQLLVKLDDSKFAATLAEAEANLKLRQANFLRAQQLFKDKLVSNQDYDQNAALYEVSQAGVTLMRRQLKDTRVYAPFAGIVGARAVSPGQVISRNTVLTTLVDLDPVKVEVHVPERFLSQLRVGQTLEIGVASYPGRRFTGRVYFIESQLDPRLRTALVKALIPNDLHELRPGMFANLDLTLTIREKALAIPEIALSWDGDAARVFVIGSNDAAVLKPIKLGVRLPGLVEVTGGLTPGERLIVEGIQKVVPGAKVKSAAVASAGAGPGSMGGK